MVMGTLDWKAEDKRIQLRVASLFGRHPECDLRIENTSVSSEHAALHWRGHGWELRDLNSRNGTFVNGKRLALGERLTLNSGATFSLSRSGPLFELVDASPPAAAARNNTTGKWSLASCGLLALPSEKQPIVTLFRTSDGHWAGEIDGATRKVTNGEQIRVGGDTYALEVPDTALETLQSTAPAGIDSIRLRLAVAPDEEHVEVTVMVDGQARRLPSRRYHYLLVTLARAWLADANAPLSLRGYMDRNDLCKKLAMDVNKLNVEIHRARRQLAAIGIDGAAGLVERRPGTFEVRIGIHDVEVMRL